jgi:hypothetical protein
MFDSRLAELAHHALFDHGDPDVGETATFEAYGSLRRFVIEQQKLYFFEYGFVRILCNGDGAHRLVMRNQDGTRPLVNHFTMPGMELLEDELLTYTTMNYADPGQPRQEILFYTFQKPDAAGAFRREYMKAIQENRKLLGP